MVLSENLVPNANLPTAVSAFSQESVEPCLVPPLLSSIFTAQLFTIYADRTQCFIHGGRALFFVGTRERERTGSSDTYDVNFNSESKCRKQFPGTVAARINALKGRGDFPYRGGNVS